MERPNEFSQKAEQLLQIISRKNGIALQKDDPVMILFTLIEFFITDVSNQNTNLTNEFQKSLSELLTNFKNTIGESISETASEEAKSYAITATETVLEEIKSYLETPHEVSNQELTKKIQQLSLDIAYAEAKNISLLKKLAIGFGALNLVVLFSIVMAIFY